MVQLDPQSCTEGLPANYHIFKYYISDQESRLANHHRQGTKDPGIHITSKNRNDTLILDISTMKNAFLSRQKCPEHKNT